MALLLCFAKWLPELSRAPVVEIGVISTADRLNWNRGHWGIENRSHRVRDVTFGEDGCKVRVGSGPQNLAAFRNAAISLLRLGGTTNIAAALRENAYIINPLLAKPGMVKK